MTAAAFATAACWTSISSLDASVVPSGKNAFFSESRSRSYSFHLTGCSRVRCDSRLSVRKLGPNTLSVCRFLRRLSGGWPLRPSKARSAWCRKRDQGGLFQPLVHLRRGYRSAMTSLDISPLMLHFSDFSPKFARTKGAVLCGSFAVLRPPTKGSFSISLVALKPLMVFGRWQPCGRGVGIELVVASGDLTTARVDAIVSASGGDLSYDSGVGAAIVAKGGTVVEEDCEAWVAQNPFLLAVGEVATTRAGKLPCCYVIHAAGPSVKARRGTRPTPTPEEAQQLRNVVRSALGEADRLKLASIAMPAISCGNFMYPKDLATLEIVDACVAFAIKKKKTTLKSIVLMDIDLLTHGYFVDALWGTAEQRGERPESLKKLAFDNQFAQTMKSLFTTLPVPLLTPFEFVSTESAEYKSIIAELPDDLASRVVSVRRVQSLDQSVAYEMMKRSVIMQGARVAEVEPLYHGTPARWRATSIAMDGFDLCHREHGRSHGDGVYTSSDLDEAIDYIHIEDTGSVLRLRGLVVSNSTSCGYNTIVEDTMHVFPTPNALLPLAIIDFAAEDEKDRAMLRRR